MGTIVVRGPVPRERSVLRERGEGLSLALRFGKGSWRAILCGNRSAGACSPRSFNRPEHGEGQALALQFPVAISSHRSAGACPPRSFDLREDCE